MANYYDMTSFNIEIKNKEFIKDLMIIFQEYDDESITVTPKWFQDVFYQENFPEPEPLGIDYSIENDMLWIRAEEYFNISIFANIVRVALKHYNLNDCVCFEVSHSCSKMYIDQFGGSGVFITKDNVEIFSTSDWVRSKKEAHRLSPYKK